MFNLYKTIEDLCNTRGITVQEMSRQIGIHRNVMPRLKADPTKTLSLKTIEKLSVFFNVPMDHFRDLGEIDPSDIPPEEPITDSQLLFALYGEVPEEIDDADIADIKRYANMVRLRKIQERSQNESD